MQEDDLLKINVNKPFHEDFLGFSVDVYEILKAGDAVFTDNRSAVERDNRSRELTSKAVEAASLTIFCWTADCERLHLRVEIHLYITRQWALSCLQSNTD